MNRSFRAPGEPLKALRLQPLRRQTGSVKINEISAISGKVFRAHFKCASSRRLTARASRLARALGRPTLSLRMPDRKPEFQKARIGLVWLVLRWVSRTREGPTPGTHQPLATQANFYRVLFPSSATGFQAVALTSSDSAAGWLPDFSPWPPPPTCSVEEPVPSARGLLRVRRAICWSKTVPAPACILLSYLRAAVQST